MSSAVNHDPRAGRRPEQPLHVLFVGEQMSNTHKHFKRADELVRCEYAADMKTAADMIIMQAKVRKFDCVIIDMRRDSDGAPVDAAALAGLKAAGTFNVMALPSEADQYRAIDGVDSVLVEPVVRADIVSTVIESATPREKDKPEFVEIPKGFSSSEAFSVSASSESDESKSVPIATEAADSTIEISAKDMAEVENLAVHAQIGRAKEVLAELSAGKAVDSTEDFAPVEGNVLKAESLEPSKQPKPDSKDEEPTDHAVEASKTENAPLETATETVAVAEPVTETLSDALEEEVPQTEPQPAEAAVEAEVSKVAKTKSDEAVPKNAVTKGFESSLSKIQEVDQSIWQRFVPLANFVYKKLAIVVLTALFATFVAYGAMIVFFMGSSSWSLPFELSRGHALVEKIDRDLSSMSLRRNQVRQDLTVAEAEGVKADRDYRDGKLQLTLTKRTVEEEIVSQTATQLEIKQHIDRLKRVINDFNAINGKGGFAKNLEGAYSKRLITRRSLNSGTLAVLETLHRMATVQNEISVKQLELRRVDRRLEFLRSLLEEIDQPEIRVITSAGSDLAHLAREVIEAKNRIANATKVKATADKRIARLDNSLQVISNNIEGLEATPAARARFAPVMVLFVPYTNSGQTLPGEPLYRCLFSIVICSEVGEVGRVIDGETTAVHPLFGKPMRGNFVEAKFTNPQSVREELMHAGSKPLGF